MNQYWPYWLTHTHIWYIHIYASLGLSMMHDDVIKWEHFPRYWPFVREIHWSPVSSPHKGLWRGALMFSLICAWMDDWVSNREAGDLRRPRAHYNVIVMHSNLGLIITSLSCIPTLHKHFRIFSCDQAALWMVQSVCLSVCPSVRHIFLTMFPSSYHHDIFRSYYQWQKWRPCKRSRSQRSQPNLTVSGL